MKILFITRTYPPLVGGMEKFASDFYVNYQKRGTMDLLANSGGRKTILLFFIRTVFFLILHAKDYDIVHIYDAVLSPLALVVKAFSRAKVSFTVNGLDIVYSRFGYQKLIPFFLKRADRIIAISQYTMEQCELRGVTRGKLVVIPVGIDFNQLKVCSNLEIAETLVKFDLPAREGKTLLLTVGRLVKRKGHAWFITHVFTKLPEHYHYLIAGAGPEQDLIAALVRDLSLTSRVFLLGRVSDQEKNCLYQISDLFVMPNIHVKNDQEGFGIVLLEAGRYGLPVIASNIEGIRDAILDQETGRLVGEGDAHGFMQTITQPNPMDRSSLSNTVAIHFGWERIIERYYEEFEKLLIR